MSETASEVVVEDVEKSGSPIAHANQGDSQRREPIPKSSENSPMGSPQASHLPTAPQNYAVPANPASDVASPQASNAATNASDQRTDRSAPAAPVIAGLGDVAEQVNEPEDHQRTIGDVSPSLQEANNNETSSQAPEKPDSPNEATGESKASTDVDQPSETAAPAEIPPDASTPIEASSEAPAQSNRGLADNDDDNQPLLVKDTKPSGKSPRGGQSSPAPEESSVGIPPDETQPVEALSQDETAAANALVKDDTDSKAPTQDDNSLKDRGDLCPESSDANLQNPETSSTQLAAESKAVDSNATDDNVDISLDLGSSTQNVDTSVQGTTGSATSPGGDKDANEDSADASAPEAATETPALVASQPPEKSAGPLDISKAN